MYPIVHKYIDNFITIDELKTQAVVIDWRLAKRQLTWFRRNEYIHWDTPDNLNTYLSDQLVTAE
jgi:tRNA A37 N6-isopentenylltransferase MiaA